MMTLPFPDVADLTRKFTAKQIGEAKGESFFRSGARRTCDGGRVEGFQAKDRRQETEVPGKVGPFATREPAEAERDETSRSSCTKRV